MTERQFSIFQTLIEWHDAHTDTSLVNVTTVIDSTYMKQEQRIKKLISEPVIHLVIGPTADYSASIDCNLLVGGMSCFCSNKLSHVGLYSARYPGLLARAALRTTSADAYTSTSRSRDRADERHRACHTQALLESF